MRNKGFPIYFNQIITEKHQLWRRASLVIHSQTGKHALIGEPCMQLAKLVYASAR
jgi:hypothetical protein